MMSPKKAAATAVSASPRMKRKIITLEMKLDVLQPLECGEEVNDIYRATSLISSNVCTVSSKADKIKERTVGDTPECKGIV